MTEAVRLPTRGHPAYSGPHEPLPDGRCRHRWANRLRRIVHGCPVAAVALARPLIEAEATAAAEQRLRAAEVVVEAARAAWKAAYFSGPEVGDLETALAAYDRDSPASASPRQGEPVALDVMAEPMRAYIGVGAGKPRTEAGRLWHAEWHSGEYPNAPRKCGSMGCGFLGRILGLEAAALSEPAEAGEPG